MNKTYKYFSNISNMIPFLPDFGRPEVIMRIIIGMFYVCIIYSFTNIDSFSNVANKLYENIKGITPYIMVEILSLILISNRIKKINPILQIIILTIITLVNVYVITSISINSPYEIFSNVDRAISLSIVSLGLVFFFIIYFDWSERNSNPDMVKARLLSLQSKMRPHFLFNTLNSISFLIKEQPEIAEEMVTNLSELLRASLKDDEDSVWTINDEIEICKKYLSIEKIRLEDRLTINFNIAENTLNYLLPKISLQPIVENAILHGIQKIKGGGFLEIKIEADKRLNIQISNTISNTTIKTNNGYSMKNLNKRLNMVFKGDYQISSEVSENSYIVKLNLPKRK